MPASATNRLLIVATLTIFVAGCGGRVSHPIAATTPYDDQLDCAHLQAEKAVNAKRADDLVGERKNATNNNVGMVLVSPLFLDLSNSEKTEMEAFASREKVLDGLMAGRCPKTAEAP